MELWELVILINSDSNISVQEGAEMLHEVIDRQRAAAANAATD